jgi:8-oxo-dGTP pyrophosphatase MutT (NUDIX family)
MTESWEGRIASFWAGTDGKRPEQLWSALAVVLADRSADDPRTLFEQASLHDFLGEEAAAIPLYRCALDRGLGGEFRSQAVIQCASSLRNVGDASGAIALLRTVAVADPLKDAADAFLALALFDDAKSAPALRTALHALTPHLPAYRDAIDDYADSVMAPRRVRNVVVGVLIQDEHVLAEEYPGTAYRGPFLRAPGGGLTFGETRDVAIRREFREELGVDLDAATLLGVLENIFVTDRKLGPKHGHELMHVYGVRSAALEALPRDARLPVRDSDTTVGWYALDAVRSGDAAPPGDRARSGLLPFYPAGALELAEAHGAG